MTKVPLLLTVAVICLSISTIGTAIAAILQALEIERIQTQMQQLEKKPPAEKYSGVRHTEKLLTITPEEEEELIARHTNRK